MPEDPAMPNTAKEVVRGIMGTKLKVNPFLARLMHSISKVTLMCNTIPCEIYT